MNFELKPVKKLIIGSIILHMAGLFIATTLLVFFQRPLWPLFTGSLFPEGGTLFFPPVIASVSTIAVFIFHCGLTIVFLRVVNYRNIHLKQLHTFSILTLIVVSAVFPISSFVWAYLEHFIIARSMPTADMFLALSITRNLMAFGLVIRNISMSVLLIAASMSWYYCFIKKAENKETDYIV